MFDGIEISRSIRNLQVQAYRLRKLADRVGTKKPPTRKELLKEAEVIEDMAEDLKEEADFDDDDDEEDE